MPIELQFLLSIFEAVGNGPSLTVYMRREAGPDENDRWQEVSLIVAPNRLSR
jgi:hypothetical protein